MIQGRKMDLKKQESLGSNELMMVMQGMSDHYLEKICRKGEFVDHITLQIIIIYIHPRSATKHIVLPGGEFGSQEKSINKPIYVAFYDEVCFRTGHYQAIAPLVENQVFPPDVASRLPSRTVSFQPEANSTALRKEGEVRVHRVLLRKSQELPVTKLQNLLIS